MKRALFVALVLICNGSVADRETRTLFGSPFPASQQAKETVSAFGELEKLKLEQKKIGEAQELVREWFRRWSALDGTEESVNRLMELYGAGASRTLRE